MKIRTQLKAGGGWANHNETLAVRTALKAGGVDLQHNEALQVRTNHTDALAARTALKAGKRASNHSEALGVRSALKAGGVINHSETLQTRTGLKAGRINLRAAVQTTARKADRLELLVVRAGLRAAARCAASGCNAERTLASLDGGRPVCGRPPPPADYQPHALIDAASLFLWADRLADLPSRRSDRGYPIG